MIETEQNILVQAPIGRVWDYVQDMQRWANIMPGYREFEVIDANESRWVLKVGVGGLVRTVKVLVLVDEWAGPEKVRFSFRLDGDPVQGSGTYAAMPSGAGATQITLGVQVEGSGPMARMWEAMGGPLLPKFAQGFAEQLKARIELTVDAVSVAQLAAAGAPSILARIAKWLRRFWSVQRDPAR
ncbi:CoxG family protein [Acidocella sp.]|uniref:CoxG family protein n=1 Tax=Acidocella sp. TaxID=50710 RepID=UPI0026323FC0|nr:SRPBCC family protein [Acidocella sp.]